MSLWSFLRSFFRQRAAPKAASRPHAFEETIDLAPAPEPAPVPEAETAGPEALEPGTLELETPSAAHTSVDSAVLLADDEEDEWGPDEDEDAEDEGPDPFISSATPLHDPDVDDAQINILRGAARILALGGVQRLPLSTPAGPGSLAEALNELVEQGLVKAEFIADTPEGPIMVYRPIEPQKR